LHLEKLNKSALNNNKSALKNNKSALKNSKSALENNLRKITQVSEKTNKSALQKRFEK
jgi:hypothetical protein